MTREEFTKQIEQIVAVEMAAAERRILAKIESLVRPKLFPVRQDELEPALRDIFTELLED